MASPRRAAGIVLVLQLVGLMLIGLTPLQTDALRLSEFLAFGPDFDESLPMGDNPSVTVDLAQPITYFGQVRTRITVSKSI